MTMPVRSIPWHLGPTIGLSLALVACSHDEPFTPHDTSLTIPLVAGPPFRLAYTPGGASTPAFLPEAGSIIYAYVEGESRQQNDQCLGIMPVTGGTLTSRICNAGVFSSDSTDTFAWPAVSPGGQLAYLRSTRPISAQADVLSRLVYAQLASPDSFTTAQLLPYQGADAFYAAAADLAWLGEDRIAFLGLTDVTIPSGGSFINVRSGHDVLVATLGADGTTVTPVTGTTRATSVTAGPGEDEIYFTLAGSSQIFRTLVPSGTPTAVYDFGNKGIVRDVQAAGGQLVAIVGGLVTVTDANGDPLQRDRGGRMFLVDVAAGTAQELPKPATIFRNPALAPDGRAVVAEAYPLRVSTREVGQALPPVVDTVVTGGPELWEFPLR